MVSGRKLLGSLVLVGALAMPATFSMRAMAQDEHHDQDRDRDRDKHGDQDRDHDRDREHDRDHDRRMHEQGNHQWSDREDAPYRRWTTDNHRQYQDYDKLSKEDQERYWNWRQSHPDNR